MRCTLKIEKHEAYSPVLRHGLDLYHDDQVQKLIRKAAERLETGTSKTGQSLTKLTSHLENYRLEELAKVKTSEESTETHQRRKSSSPHFPENRGPDVKDRRAVRRVV